MKTSSLTGVLNSQKNNSPIHFESSLERDFVYLLEYDKSVASFIEQPVEIPILDVTSSRRRYIPDFAVSYHNEQLEIIEIKYKATLLKKRDELQPKFLAAEDFCNKNNIKFKVITDDYIRTERGVELENYKFLSRFRDYFESINKKESGFPTITPEIGLLMETLLKLRKASVESLLAKCTKDVEKKSELLFLVWYLIANNFINTDFNKKLSQEAIIWIK